MCCHCFFHHKSKVCTNYHKSANTKFTYNSSYSLLRASRYMRTFVNWDCRSRRHNDLLIVINMNTTRFIRFDFNATWFDLKTQQLHAFFLLFFFFAIVVVVDRGWLFPFIGSRTHNKPSIQKNRKQCRTWAFCACTTALCMKRIEFKVSPFHRYTQ